MLRPLALLLPLIAAMPALAQPVCIAQREGMTACFSNRLCECRHEPGGSLTGRPAGYRWDCDIMRPACSMAPADSGPAYPPPPIMVTPNYGFPPRSSFPQMPGVQPPPQVSPLPR